MEDERKKFLSLCWEEKKKNIAIMLYSKLSFEDTNYLELLYEGANLGKSLLGYVEFLTRGKEPDQIPLKCSHLWLYLEEQVNRLASQITKKSLLSSKKTYRRSSILLLSKLFSYCIISFVDDLVAGVYL